jgi:hypothetical protein
VTVTVESAAFEPEIETPVSGWMTPGPIDHPPTAAAGDAIASRTATAKTRASPPIAPTAGREARILGTAKSFGFAATPLIRC